MSDDDENDMIERASAGDVEAALTLGRRFAPRDYPASNAWFRTAVRAGGSSVMHRVIDYLEANPPHHPHLLGVWIRRACIAAYPRTDAPHIHVAASTFRPLDERGAAAGEPDPRLVIQANAPGSAQLAVQRAVHQFGIKEPTLRFSAVRCDDQGAHVTIESGQPRFAQLFDLVNTIITELAGAGVRAAYLRPESAKAWIPTDRPEPTFAHEISRLAARAADDISGEAAFKVGIWCQEDGFPQCADVWFKQAIAQAGFAMLLRVIDEYALRFVDGNGERLADWMTRSRQIEFPRLGAPRILINRALFAPILIEDRAGYGHDTSVQITSPETDAATLALERAARRFGRVTADGREFFTDEELQAAEPAAEEDWDAYYTPNYVSSVSIEDGHPTLSMDWKDTMAPAMGRAMIHILIDELLAAGVTQCIVRPRPKSAD